MRIRSIKPEFWVSESIGRLSRDARLLFIGLWSFADDSGRGRGAIAAISGSLLPYDSDALGKLPKWLDELEREGMIRRYKAEDGNSYYDLPKWLKHQKIERPSKSRIPAFTEPSPDIHRTITDISPQDQGSGIRDQGAMEQGAGTEDQGAGNEEQFISDICRDESRREPVEEGSAGPQEEPIKAPEGGDGTQPVKTRENGMAVAAKAILEVLNTAAGRSFEPVKANLDPICHRLAEVREDVEGIKAMVLRQVSLWKTDDRMNPYLRPATLFNRTKFHGYYADRNLPATNGSHRGTGVENARNARIGGKELWEAGAAKRIAYMENRGF